MRDEANLLANAAPVMGVKPSYRYSPALIPGIMTALDIAMIVLSLAIAFVLTVPYEHEKIHIYLFVVMSVTIVYCFAGGLANFFSVEAAMNPLKRSDDILIALVSTALILLSVILGLKVYALFPKTWLWVSLPTAFTAVMTSRFAAAAVLAWLASRGVMGSAVVVVGSGEQARGFLRYLKRSRPYFVTVVGVFEGPGGDGAADEIEGVPVLGDVAALFACARAAKIDDIVVALPWTADRQVVAMVESLRELPVNVYLGADLAGLELAFRPAPGHLNRTPMFEVVQRPISGWNAALKMVEDYAIASVALILIAPLLAAIAIAIRLDSPGPVFFMQRRLGFNNKEFLIYKFRTMRHNRVDQGIVRQATRNDPRVTRVGRILRATSLDELPQLLNVLNGTMSLVGPRPHAISHNEDYSRQIRGYFARHRVKPGITGWAQVNGLRGETEQLEKMRRRIEHDIYYSENWSVLFDLRILVMTALLVLFQKSAY